MKINEHTGMLNRLNLPVPASSLLRFKIAIVHEKITLVPYSEHHVPKYHFWMQDEKLQELTASEPMSLESEYSMQRSWRSDHDKLTFIVCTSFIDKGQTITAGARNMNLKSNQLEMESMIGDINIFFSEEDAEDPDSTADDNSDTKVIVGEIELMIAETTSRGKGLGSTILMSFLYYVLTNLEVIMNEYGKGAGADPSQGFGYFRARINATNTQSIRLFQKIGFTKMHEVPNVFGELELRCSLDEARKFANGCDEELYVVTYNA